MKWIPGYRSGNVEDRRGSSGGRGFSLGGVGMLASLFKLFGLPGLLVGAALLYFGSGGGLSGGNSAVGTERAAPTDANDPEKPMVEMVSVVFDDVQSTWSEVFRASGQRYQPAKLVLFRDSWPSGCGTGSAAMGPFYCPRDQRAYIDLSFYHELKQRFGAPGDFAQAYVIAHEIGHHVQNLLGTSDRVHRAGRGEQTGENSLAVRLELQADCYAGIWAHHTSQRRDLKAGQVVLEPGDVDEALTAAAAIGDDRMQKHAGGAVSPESWTHGSSAQRVRWFKRGYEVGNPEGCDTFSASKL
jgi:uncharacterized protein